MSDSHLTPEDLFSLDLFLMADLSCWDLVSLHGRHHMTTSREFRRNVTKRGIYCNREAHQAAMNR